MNLIILVELVAMKESKKQRNILNVNLLELIPMDGDYYDYYVELSRVKNYIDKSKKKLTKESLICNLSRRLLELKFKKKIIQ